MDEAISLFIWGIRIAEHLRRAGVDRAQWINAHTIRA